MDSGEFDGPGGRSGIEAGFAEALQASTEVSASDAKRKQVGGSGEAATEQAGEEGELAAAPVGERAGDEAGEEGHDGEDADGIAYGAVRTAEIMADVEGQDGQNGAHAEETKERRGNQGPEAETKARF